MRRNNRGGPRGGGQNWQQQRHNNAPLLSAGPLMTDHLGLQDIDKELELLKRKREIIEQQQQILSHEFMRNEPQFNQSSRFDDYSKLYDDMRTYDHPSRKRPIAVWQDEIPNKRFSGPSRAPRARPHRSGPVFNAGYVGAQPRQPYRPQNKTPQTKPPQKNLNNSKVTKNTPPMNKLDTYPVAERKKLIGEANGTADGKAKLSKLRADREPSAQMTGRLELALGSIIKDIKSNPAHTDAIKSMSVMRQIKKTVRDRIREVMMDQIVGPGDVIKARYRQVYDEQSDNEIVEKALRFVVSTDPSKIVTPEAYFKANMNKIVETRLKEMLKTLEEVTCGKVQILRMEEPPAADADAESKPDETPKDEDVEKMEKSETFLALEKMMMHRILLSIKKQIPHIVHIQNMDGKFNQLKNNIATETIKKLTRKPGDVSPDFSEDIADATLQAISTPKAPRTPYKPLPYFAKLMGKPGLPKRNLMQVFFEEYQPKSIKKHRSVHNLLFVGFEDKEAFDKLLAADGTKIGKFTLSIRVSERSQETKLKASQLDHKQEPSAEQNEENSELDTSISSVDKILGSELGDQITNLLTAIKKDSEDQLEADANSEVKEGGDVKNEDSTVEEPENNDNANNDNQETDITDIHNTEADDANTEADNKNIDEKSTPQTVEEVDNIGEANTQDTNGAQPDVQKEEAEKADAVPEITEAKLKGTPVRTSARLASTPSRIQTRRASRLVTNDA